VFVSVPLSIRTSGARGFFCAPRRWTRARPNGVAAPAYSERETAFPALRNTAKAANDLAGAPAYGEGGLFAAAFKVREV
jgi:hypothetical protein